MRTRPGARSSSGCVAEPAHRIRQRRRAALKSPPASARRIRPVAAPARAAKSSRRVATNDGASTVAIPPATAPDLSASSSAQSASACRWVFTQIDRGDLTPHRSNPRAKGRPRSCSQSVVVTKTNGRASSRSTRRDRANPNAVPASAGSAAVTSSSGSAALGKTAGSTGAGRSSNARAVRGLCICSYFVLQCRLESTVFRQLRSHLTAVLRDSSPHPSSAVRKGPKAPCPRSPA